MNDQRLTEAKDAQRPVESPGIGVDMPTLYVFLSLLGVLIIYDTWTLLRRGYETTISSQLYTAALAQPVIPLAIGIVIGHLFWPNKASRSPK